MKLGIDFGTTRTVVAAAADGRYPIASFETPDGFRDYLPGLVAWDGQRWIYGWDAAAALERGEAAGHRSIKRLVSGLAPDEVVPGLPAPATALELATGYARHVRDMLVRRGNLDVGARERLEAAIAVPANAGSRQRYLTLEAFTRAGFHVLGMINEPTAAAVEFAYRNGSALAPRSPKRYVVVYDLGGGTFDTAAVSLEGRRFELLASEGIGRLGGDDFDEIILACALEQAGFAGEIAGSVRDRLLEVCREAKEGLRNTSRKLLVDVSAALPAVAEPVVLDLASVYARVEPLIERSVDLVEEIFARLAAHGIDGSNPRELGGLYLVGGGVAFPPVVRSLRARYKRKIQLAPQPYAATAIGLAVFADPEADIFVREAVTRHFGVWREGEDGREKIFDPILSKDRVASTGEPVVVHRVYRPAHRIGHLRFLECARLDAAGQPSGDLTPWRELRFPYDPDLADRKDLERIPVERRALDDEIAETYTYRHDGTIAVDIENRTRGYRRSFVLGAMR